MFARLCSRWPFIAAVALFAAVISDVAVEALANTGIFGRAYFDTDDSTIVPALIVAALLASGVIVSYMAAACRRSRAGRRHGLASVARDVAAHAPLRDAGSVLGVQFAALYGMETAEQVLAHGHAAGGFLWLGGPPLTSAAAHLAIGLLCTLAAGKLMRCCVPHFASLVCCALDFVLCARPATGSAVFIVRRDAMSCSRVQAAHVGRLSGRAPPFVSLPA